MRKVLVITALAGFIRSFLENDIRTLQEMGYEVDCAANPDHPGAENIHEYFQEIGTKFHEISFSSNAPVSKETFTAYRPVKKLLKENQYEMIHVHTPIAGAVVRMAAGKLRKKGCKIVYTTHGFFFHKGSGKKSWMLYYNVEKFFSRRTDMMITINKEDYHAAKTMKCGSVRYINGVGVDTKRILDAKIDRKAYREELGIKEEELMVVSIGELSVRKNHQIIIKALGKLDTSKYVYVICGNDMNASGTSASLKELAEENHVNLRLLGLRSDVPQICHCADIGAFPSTREGLGLAGIELMTAGVPLAASGVQGILDYMEDGKTGYLCEPYNVEQYAYALERLSDKTVRESMKKNCVHKAMEFDKAISVSQTKEIYKELLG